MPEQGMAAPRDMPPIWMLRHGQTEWNLIGRLQGHQDSPLTEAGRAQAQSAGHRLAAQVPKTALRIVSPLGRAVATARLAFGPLPFTTDPRLIEIGTGDWTGMRLADLSARHPDLFAAPPLEWYDQAPAGETFARLSARIAGFLDDLPARAGGRAVVLITHGVTLRVLRAQLLGQSIAHETHIQFPQGAIHHVENGTVRLV